MKKKNLISVALSLGVDAAKEPPNEFRIFALGPMDTTKGKFTVDKPGLEQLMASAKDYGNDFQIDYEHQSVLTVGKAPSAGWFTPDLRDDGLYAKDVQWNDDAKKMLKSREYRYFSPTFFTDGEGRVVELVNLALTNNPATKRMKPLIASRVEDEGEEPQKEETMDKLKMMLLGALALAATASDEEILKAVSDLRGKANANDHVIQLNALTGKTTAGESLGYITALKQDAEAKDKKIVELTGKVTDLEKSGREAEVARIVEDGIRDGKIAPAQKEMMLSQGRKDIDFLKGFLSTASKVVPTDAKQPPKEGEGTPAANVMLTDEQKRAAQILGVDANKVAETMAKAKLNPATA